MTSRRVLAQARFDLTVLLRNGEQVLLALVLPVLILIGLSRTEVVRLGVEGSDQRIALVAPGVLALAVMSTAFTGQAIGTGFDRRHGVLRLLGTTPLGRGGLIAGRILAVVGMLGVQALVLVPVAIALGWRPEPSGVPAAVLATGLGAAAFVALGLLLAGTLRAEAVLAGANLVWVLLLAGGGIVIPPDRLGALEPVAGLLPSGALGEALRDALRDGAFPTASLLLLGAWAVLAAVAAARWFRWN